MKTILFADNDPDFLEVRSEFLELEGYQVLKANSPQQAREILDRRCVHLAILDVRLEEDALDDDTSGIELAQEEAYDTLAKIILTGFPNVNGVKKVMKHRQDQMPSALDYISKERVEDMIEAVHQAFDEHVRIRWDLKIEWKDQNRFALVHLIFPGLEGERLLARADELEDLLRRLFYEKDQIRLDRMLWQRDGRVALVIFAFQKGAPSESFVVVCGPRPLVQMEVQKYRDFAPNAAGDNGTALHRHEETIHFGALAYALTDADLENARSLIDIYRSAPEREFRTALTVLFQETLAGWQKERLVPEETRQGDILYLQRLHLAGGQFSPADFEARLHSILRQVPALGKRMVTDGEQLSLFFDRQAYTYPDPVKVFFQQIEARWPTTLVTTPGLLSGANILAGPDEHAWLTDFLDAGLAPFLWNFVALEALIRFDWVETNDMLRLHEIERCLLGDRFNRLDMQIVEPVVRRPLNAIQIIRQLAYPMVAIDEFAYQRGIFFQAAHRITATNLSTALTANELARLAHAVMAVAMIGEKISQSLAKSSQALPAQLGIEIDKKGQTVKVEGRLVALRGQGYQLLCYLYDHPDQVCSRQEIFQNVLKIDQITRSEEDRLNAAISRLREKIEADPERPHYLFTHEGVGYSLSPLGK